MATKTPKIKKIDEYLITLIAKNKFINLNNTKDKLVIISQILIMDKIYSSLEKLANTNVLGYKNSKYENEFLSLETRSFNFSNEVSLPLYTSISFF